MGFKLLAIACKKIYGIENGPLLTNQIKLVNYIKWHMTNNVAMHRHTLKTFVRRCAFFAILIDNAKSVGLAFARPTKLHSVLSGGGYVYLGDGLGHLQMNSHKAKDFKITEAYSTAYWLKIDVYRFAANSPRLT